MFAFYIINFRVSDKATARLTSEKQNWEHYVRVLPEDRIITLYFIILLFKND